MSSLNDFSQRKAAHLWPLTLLRIYTGVFFLKFGFGKLRNADFSDGLAGFVSANLDKSFGFMRPFLESVVLPHQALFGFLVSWGEVLVGLSLIIGLATRYAAVGGALMVAAFWFTKGQGLLDAQNHDAIWFMIFVVLATVHAGRQHSVDEKLAGRFRFLG